MIQRDCNKKGGGALRYHCHFNIYKKIAGSPNSRTLEKT